MVNIFKIFKNRHKHKWIAVKVEVHHITGYRHNYKTNAYEKSWDKSIVYYRCDCTKMKYETLDGKWTLDELI